MQVISSQEEDLKKSKAQPKYLNLRNGTYKPRRMPNISMDAEKILVTVFQQKTDSQTIYILFQMLDKNI